MVYLNGHSRTNGGEDAKKMEKKNHDSEVEEMLRAAQDELLLNLSVNSHTTRGSSDSLLPDLDRRFQALKSPPQPPQQLPRQLDNTSTASATDVFARFTALKGSPSTTIPSPPSDDEDDEVEKIIRWAKDAARLDPSPPSDDEMDDDDDDDEEEEEDQFNKDSKK